MRFAVQENIVPGRSFREKVENLREFGYEGVELRGDELPSRVQEIRSALRETGVTATCICGGFKFGLLFPSAQERKQSREEIKRLLFTAAEVGAMSGVIVVPIFGPPQLPDLSPWKTATELEEELLVEQLVELSEYAGQEGTKVILEPLNRYETHLLNRLEQAAHIYHRVNSPNLTMLADFFHMQIEEVNIATAMKAFASLIGYVHLADSNRLLPGLGHTDFSSGFLALAEAGYTGWMSLECGVQGDPSKGLCESLRYMQASLPR